MRDPLKAALVGCGSVSQRGILPHLSQPDARERVRLVAVADAVAERARLSAERFNVPAHFSDVESLLDGADVDLVIVATPITHHYENAMAAVARGKHVYVQKAMTTTLAEADALLAARDRAGVRLAAAPGFELFPTTGRMRRLLRDGAIGTVYVAYTYTLGFGHETEGVRTGQGALRDIDPGWYFRAGAGPLPDVTVYSLQLITSLLGPVRRVTALANTLRPLRSWRGSEVAVEVPDNNVVLMEFAGGTLGVAVGADCQGSAHIPWGGLGLYGTDGALEVTAVDASSGYPVRFEVQGGPDGVRGEHAAELGDQPYLRGDHLTQDEPHVYADIMELADAIVEDRPPRASGEQARHVVEIVERAHEAARTGTAQDLTSTFAFPDSQ